MCSIQLILMVLGAWIISFRIYIIVDECLQIYHDFDKRGHISVLVRSLVTCIAKFIDHILYLSRY